MDKKIGATVTIDREHGLVYIDIDPSISPRRRHQQRIDQVDVVLDRAGDELVGIEILLPIGEW